MKLSNCGKYSIVSYSDNTTLIWNIVTEEVIYTFNDHSDKVISIAVSHDMKYVVTGSLDKTAIV